MANKTKKEEVARPSKAVFYVLIDLLKFKSFTTIAELAKISKVPTIELIQILIKNKFLLVKDHRGNITGLNTKGILDVKYKLKQTYISGTYLTNRFLYFENWETDELTTKFGTVASHRPNVNSYTVTSLVLADTPENRKRLEDRGMVLSSTLAEQLNLSEYWDEV